MTQEGCYLVLVEIEREIVHCQLKYTNMIRVFVWGAASGLLVRALS